MPYFLLRLGLLWIYPQQNIFNIADGPIYDELDVAPTLQEIDERLQRTKPEIIIVGSSLADRAIDRASLAEKLGLREDSVQIIWIGMATMPNVLLMIQNRILSKDLTPKAIIVAATPAWMLTNKIPNQTGFELHQTTTLDPEVARILKIEQSWNRMLSQKKSRFQTAYLNLIRIVFGSWIFDYPTIKVEGRLERVFIDNDQRTDIEQHKLIQVIPAKANPEAFDWSEIPAEEDRLVYHLIKDVKDANINLVLVHLPVSKVVLKQHSLDDDIMISLIQKYRELGAGYLDYFDWDQENIFKDTKHLNSRGRELFTEMISKDLQRIRVLEKDMIVADLPNKLKVPTFNFETKEHSLRKGEELNLNFQYSWEQAKITACISGKWKPPLSIFRVNGQIMQSEQTSGSEHWCEHILVEDITPETNIQIKNSRLQQMLIHQIMIDDVKLITNTNISRLRGEELIVAGKNKPASITKRKKIPPWIQNEKNPNPNLHLGILSKYTEVVDIELAKFNIPLECSPLEVRERNEIFGTTNRCKPMRKENKDRSSCYLNKWWLALSERDIDWKNTQVQLKENRRCAYNTQKNAWWVYPNDTIHFKPLWFKDNHSRIRIFGNSIGEGTWKITVKNEHKTFLETSILGLDYKQEFLLDKPILKQKDRQVVVEISSIEAESEYLFIRNIEFDN